MLRYWCGIASPKLLHCVLERSSMSAIVIPSFLGMTWTGLAYELSKIGQTIPSRNVDLNVRGGNFTSSFGGSSFITSFAIKIYFIPYLE